MTPLFPSSSLYFSAFIIGISTPNIPFMTWGSRSSPGSMSLSIILTHLEGSFMFPVYAFICSLVQQLLRLPHARHAEDPRTQWEHGGRSPAFQEGIKPLNKESPHLYLSSTDQWGPTGCRGSSLGLCQLLVLRRDRVGHGDCPRAGVPPPTCEAELVPLPATRSRG